MSELIPIQQAERIRTALLDYLTTTFALDNLRTREVLASFLSDPQRGVFRGPYARLRLPFRAAEEGWERAVDWRPAGLHPYAHQAAAWQRLSSKPEINEHGPRPTLVTTGTGSGKTESFLVPILDHVARERRLGHSGLKALILYPMNALADDQANRLAGYITQNAALNGIRAAIYVGAGSQGRKAVSADGLITDRNSIRADAPDILLTNYKMLDQLLLRPADQELWRQSALSLQYLVLDEFHTYDGAQGTDVAMLLRRLGVTLKSHWPDDPALAEARHHPLGRLTPVATSATLGGGDAAPMVDFANTVFGDGFDASCVIGETRQSLDEWAASVTATRDGRLSSAAESPDSLRQLIQRVNDAVPAVTDIPPEEVAARVATALTTSSSHGESTATPSTWETEDLLALIATHPVLRRLVQAASAPQDLADLCGEISQSPADLVGVSTRAREGFIARLLTLCSHVRALSGRRAPNVDVHLWLRELSRVNRATTTEAKFSWNDDGIRRSELEAEDAPDAEETHYEYLPAIYCRRCGRSGWMTTSSAVSDAIDVDPQSVRTKSVRDKSQQRPLMYAPDEGDRALTAMVHGRRASAAEAQYLTPGLQWLHTRDNRVVSELPSSGDEDMDAGWILPVLGLAGEHITDEAANDTCPVCGTANSIRYIGSAIATMLSVAISTLFGAQSLDSAEKKALVFTDSVQDAAHRAGFIQARSRVFTFRSLLREAATEGGTLPELVQRAIAQAGDDLDHRFRLIPPSLIDHDGVKAYWHPKGNTKLQIERARKNVSRRLLFDAEAEFGRFGDLGRTLELTGTLAVSLGVRETTLLAAARAAVVVSKDQEALDGLDNDFDVTDKALLAWVHGVLYRMRRDGAILHPWLQKYLEDGGALYRLQGGRNRREGQPWLGRQSRVPSFPYARTASKKTSPAQSALENLVNLSSPQSWYAIWGARVLHADRTAVARHTRALFVALTKRGILEPVQGENIICYGLPAQRLHIDHVARPEWLDGQYRLRCDVCHAIDAAEPHAVQALIGAPCLNARCRGHLESLRGDEGAFYRRLYESHMRAVVAQEHTGLLDDADRQAAEQGFRGTRHRPDAPNVLVATPTLELGIDIGDLSTVLLASLPKSNANYQQRVGRAGRLTGNALDLAFIRGRGRSLPVLDDPLSMVDGAVRPPATYLSAEEILQRQYFAFLLDSIARDGTTVPAVQAAVDVLGHPAAETILGEAIRRAQSGESQWAPQAFLAEFGPYVSPEIGAALQSWVAPDPDGVSDLSRRVDEAIATYRQTGERIAHRLKHVEDSLDDLKAKADSAAAQDEDRRAFALAQGARKMLSRMKSEHAGSLRGQGSQNGYWISALEEYGLLPNYTLLDDSVELSVELSWYDADSGQYQADDPIRLQRGAVSAITEFAPGNTFYARGRALQIDAVDLGVNGGDVRTWAQCPECGFAQDLTGEQSLLTICPRCGSDGIADSGQRIEVVDLTRVSSQEDRDRTLISDDDDQRRRATFLTVTCADIDSTKSTSRWYAKGSGFGATYLRSLHLRQLNLGKTATGRDLRIAGQDISPGLFTVCSSCGKLDRKGDTNSPSEHRPWCPYRQDKQEHNRQIALARSLRTQGVALTLPAGMAEQDSFVLPSLKAALLFGLQMEFGGDPSHITVADVLIPDRRADQPNDRGLLLHDQVPGGTGYLASFSVPEHVWHLLWTVWERLHDCSCKGTDVLACEHCLLPFAGFDTENVSRATAERCLEEILSTHGKIDKAKLLVPAAEEHMQWDLTEEQPAAAPYDSPLEGRFAARFAELMKDRGAGIREVPGPHGNTLHIRIPGQRHEWRLQPQVDLPETRPDFGLVHPDTNDPEIMIYTDGYQYHATAENDRVIDDARKRISVRESADHERLVFSFLWDEITTDDMSAPRWWDERRQAMLIQKGLATQTMLKIVEQGPLAVLIDLFSSTDPDRWDVWRRYTEALPVGIGDPVALRRQDDLRSLALAELDAPTAQTFDARQLHGNEDLSLGTIWRLGPVLLISRLKPGTQTWEIVLTIDDRQVGQQGFREAWNSWTQLGSLLGLNRWGTTIDTRHGLQRSLDSEGTAVPADTGSETLPQQLPQLENADWMTLVEDARAEGDEILAQVVQHLGLEMSGPPPELWAEETVQGIPVPLSFHDEQVAVVLPTTEAADRVDLVAEGWVVVEASDVPGIAQAVEKRRGQTNEMVNA